MYANRVIRTAGLLFTFAIATILLAPINIFSQKQSETPPKIPYIEKVTLEDDTVIGWCPVKAPTATGVCSKSEENTLIFVRVANPTNDLEYYYSVTGGRIIGEGPDVKWDFQDTRPGQYKVTVGIGRKGVIIGNLVSSTATLRECGACDPGCECTNLTEIEEPKGPVKTGDIIVFSLSLAGTVEVKFKWEVEGGVILSSPDSETVMVKVTANPGEIMNVYADLEGNKEGCNCGNRAVSHIKIEK